MCRLTVPRIGRSARRPGGSPASSGKAGSGRTAGRTPVGEPTRIDIDDADWDCSALLIHEGVLFTGEAFEKHPNGQVIAVTSYTNGREDGPSEEWYPTGELRARGSVSDGRPSGCTRSGTATAGWLPRTSSTTGGTCSPGEPGTRTGS
jgi:hypothetical protein